MTFSVLVIKDNQPRVVGILWAADEARAQAAVLAVCPCREGEKVAVRKTEDREIPLRIPDVAAPTFC